MASVAHDNGPLDDVPAMRKVWQSEYAAVFAIFSFALAIRLYLIWRHGCISPDGVRYVEIARHFSQGEWAKGLSYFYPPGYPMLVSLMHRVIPYWELAGQFVSLAFGCFTILLLYFLIERIYAKNIAILSILLLAITPYHARLSAETRAEAPYIFFTTLSLFALVQGMKKKSLLWAGLCGLAASAAYLIRPEGGGIMIIGAIIVLIQYFRQGDWTSRKAGVFLASMFLGFSLLSSPYVLYLRHDTGRWIISRKASNVLALGLHEYEENIPFISQRESSKIDVVGLIAHNPAAFAKKFLNDLIKSVPIFAEAIHYSLFPFFLVGVIYRFRKKPPRPKDSLLWVFFVFYLLLFTFFYANRRFFVQVVPVALSWTALGVESSAQFAQRAWSQKRSFQNFLARNPILSVSMLLVIATLPKTLTPMDMLHYHLKKAGLWIRGHSSENAIVMTNQKRIAFYAERQWVEASGENQSAFLENARKHRVDYVALAGPRALVDEMFPVVTPGCELAAVFSGERGEVAEIFRLQPEEITEPASGSTAQRL